MADQDLFKIVLLIVSASMCDMRKEGKKLKEAHWKRKSFEKASS